MILIIKDGLRVSLQILTKFKWVQYFKFDWYLQWNFRAKYIHYCKYINYPIFDDLNKFKVSLLHEETSEIGKKYLVGCYASWLKDGIYTVTKT